MEAFWDAVKRNDTTTMETIVNKEPGVVSARCGYLKESPLHEAVNKHHLEAVRFLLRHGARCDHGDSVSDTPLHKAVCIGLTTILEEFIHQCRELGLELDSIKTCAGRTALHVACERSQTECIKLLLAAGCKVNVQDRQGFSPLHVAAGQYSIHVVRLLLDAQADLTINAHSSPNEGSRTGKSPIHYAMAFHKPAHTTEMLERLSDDLHEVLIAGYLEFALDINALECKTCDMVGIVLRSAQNRLGDCEVFRQVVKAKVDAGKVKEEDLPDELRDLLK